MFFYELCVCVARGGVVAAVAVGRTRSVGRSVDRWTVDGCRSW